MAAENQEQRQAKPFHRLGERAAGTAANAGEQLLDTLAEAYAVLQAVGEQDDSRPAALAFAAAKLAHYGQQEAEHVQRLILHAIGVLAGIGDDICGQSEAGERRAA